MKKIISILVALFVLLSSGCSIQNQSASSITSSSIGVEDEKIDVMSEALSLSEFESIEDFEDKEFENILFKETFEFYKNPLSVADYVVSYKPEVEKIEDLKTVADFYKFVVSEHSFELEDFGSNAGYKIYDDINDSLTELFALSDTTEGLEKAKEAFKCVEPRVSRAISAYLSAAIESYKIISEQINGISQYDFYKCQQFMYCPPQDTGDRKKAYDEVLDICKNVDTEKMLRAFNIMLNATCNLRQGIRYNNNLTEDGTELVVDTPLGAICLGTNGDDVYRSPCALLIVDLNGSDEYLGKIASSNGPSQPISVVIDLGGNDTYDNNGYSATQGSGVLGVGILFDNNGDDTYTARSLSQGAGLFGCGMLVDLWGNDSYKSSVTSQAAAHFGTGFLVDANGNDKYSSLGYSQAFAADGAVCMLIDKNGNDKYVASPTTAEGYDDMKYAQYQGAANFSQGCGITGAVAGIVDLSGYDEYKGCACVQAVGYRGGIGFISDYQGNDRYFSNCYSQAAAVELGIGTLLDMGGDDSHVISKLDADAVQGNSLGYVENGGIALMLDDFGNDFYYTHHTSFATIYSQSAGKTEPSFAAFVDTQGDDIYHVLTGDKSFGFGKGAIFVDGQGIDEYKNTDRIDAEKLFAAERNDGVFWDIELPEKPKKDDPEYEFSFLVELKDEYFPK